MKWYNIVLIWPFCVHVFVKTCVPVLRVTYWSCFIHKKLEILFFGKIITVLFSFGRKRADESPDGKRSAPPMDIRNTRGVTGLKVVSVRKYRR
uniref:SFRICE_029041 n=1 Tax=Spodoptera frugiperda TaxID=7108 RepID=A0A2H1V147_SPOFR